MNIDASAERLAAQGVAYAPQIAVAAQRHGLDPELLAAVAAQETGGPGSNAGRNVVGDGGHGHGLFQIDDRWHAFAREPDAMNPAANADYAAGMLSGLLHRYGGNVTEALSAYNAGDPSAVGTRTRWSDGSTLSYADSVMRHYAQLTGTPAQGASVPPSGAVEDARADVSSLIAAFSALPAAAAQLPTPPAPAQQPQRYQPQATDYSNDFTGDDGE